MHQLACADELSQTTLAVRKDEPRYSSGYAALWHALGSAFASCSNFVHVPCGIGEIQCVSNKSSAAPQRLRLPCRQSPARAKATNEGHRYNQCAQAGGARRQYRGAFDIFDSILVYKRSCCPHVLVPGFPVVPRLTRGALATTVRSRAVLALFVCAGHLVSCLG